MRVINTRPVGRAAALSAALTARGYTVIELPLLALTPLNLDSHLISQYQQFKTVDAVVVVSPIAAELGVKYAEQCGISLDELKQKQWIAVGKATQKRLESFGLESVSPTIETSEGMLALTELHSYVGKQIAFWRGIGGRTFMMENLIAQGTQIVNMLLYRRGFPDNIYNKDQQDFKAGDIVLISSEASWQYWLQLLMQLQSNPQNYTYMVLGDRVSLIVKQAKQRYFTVYHLDAEELHQQILQYQKS